MNGMDFYSRWGRILKPGTGHWNPPSGTADWTGDIYQIQMYRKAASDAERILELDRKLSHPSTKIKKGLNAMKEHPRTLDCKVFVWGK